MRSVKKPQMVFLPVSEIVVSDRLRTASEPAVASIDASIRELGLLNPLHVQKSKGEYVLIDGLHRLMASKRAGLDEVPAIVHRCGQRDALKIEVGTALATAPLDPLSMALFLARHKDLYEEEHPESKRAAAAQAARRGDCTGKTPVQSFAENAADIFGCNPSKIFRLVAVGKSLSKDEVSLLRRAPKRVKFSDLQALAKVSPEKRRDFCRALADGKATTARQAIRQAGNQLVNAPEDDQLRSLMDEFERASKRVKTRFVEEFATELQELLDQISGEDGGEVVPFKRGGGA